MPTVPTLNCEQTFITRFLRRSTVGWGEQSEPQQPTFAWQCRGTLGFVPHPSRRLVIHLARGSRRSRLYGGTSSHVGGKQIVQWQSDGRHVHFRISNGPVSAPTNLLSAVFPNQHLTSRQYQPPATAHRTSATSIAQHVPPPTTDYRKDRDDSDHSG